MFQMESQELNFLSGYGWTSLVKVRNAGRSPETSMHLKTGCRNIKLGVLRYFSHWNKSPRFHLDLNGQDSTLVDIQTAIKMFHKHFLSFWSYEFDEETSPVGWNVSLESSRKAEFYIKVHSENTESSLGTLFLPAGECSITQHPQKVSLDDFWSYSWGLCTTVTPNTSDTGRKRTYWNGNAMGFLDVGFLGTLYLQQKCTFRFCVHKGIEEGCHSCRMNQSRPLSAEICVPWK